MTTDISSPSLLDSKTVAAYLRVSEATLCRMRQDRSGPPFITVRGRPRYRRIAIDRWIETEEQPAERA